MTRRQGEILGAFAVLALLIVFLLWLLLHKPQEHPATTSGEQPTTQTTPPINPADVPQQSEVAATTVTRTFVERFGSYSSESDFANVTDVMSLATPRFQAELAGLVTQYRATTSSDEYTGISTYVISMKTSSSTDTTAVMSVTTQRKESVGTPGNTTVRYQDVEVSLVKNGNSWLVDGLTWK